MIQATWIDFLAQVAITLPAFLISVSFHEYCHALTAHALGDDSAKKSGRLTLNPMAHIDLLGLLFLLIFHIGWASPVPINPAKFKFPRLYSIITALAGPFSNFVLAVASFLLIKYFPGSFFPAWVGTTFVQLLSATASINIMLGVFNLLPLPPLDGSHILTALVISHFPKLAFWLYRYSFFLLLLLFIFPPTHDFLVYLIINTEQLIKSFIF